jgi:uncharacterized membrane protein
MHFEASLTVSAPQVSVYAAFTDFESMPKWSKQVTAVRVLRRDGDMVYLEALSGSDERLRTATRAMRLIPPSRIESEGETRFTHTKRAVLFEEVASGTKVTAILDVRVKRFWRLIFTSSGSETAEASLVEELASFRRYVEGLTQNLQTP